MAKKLTPVAKPKVPKGNLKIVIATFMINPEHPERGDLIESAPIAFDIYDATNKDLLPPGMLDKVTKVLKELVRLTRTHKHAVLPTDNVVAAKAPAKPKLEPGGPRLEVVAIHKETGEQQVVGSESLMDISKEKK